MTSSRPLSPPLIAASRESYESDIGVKRGIKRITCRFPSLNTSAEGASRRRFPSHRQQYGCGRRKAVEAVWARCSTTSQLSLPAVAQSCACFVLRAGEQTGQINPAGCRLWARGGMEFVGVSGLASSIFSVAPLPRAVSPGPNLRELVAWAHERTRSRRKPKLWMAARRAVSGCGPVRVLELAVAFWPNTTAAPRLLLVLLLALVLPSQAKIKRMPKRASVFGSRQVLAHWCWLARRAYWCGEQGHGGRQPAAAGGTDHGAADYRYGAATSAAGLKLPGPAEPGRRCGSGNLCGVSGAIAVACGIPQGGGRFGGFTRPWCWGELPWAHYRCWLIRRCWACWLQRSAIGRGCCSAPQYYECGRRLAARFTWCPIGGGCRHG